MDKLDELKQEVIGRMNDGNILRKLSEWVDEKIFYYEHLRYPRKFNITCSTFHEVKDKILELKEIDNAKND